MKRTLVTKWIPPSGVELKFNVDGSSNLVLGRAGIGGVLRNARGEVLCSFSIFAGNVDMATAELLAIQKACHLCVSEESLRRRCISFESDSLEALGWVKGNYFGNLACVKVIYDIRASFRMLNNPSLNFVPRASNSVADGLSKRGLASDRDDVIWSVF